MITVSIGSAYDGPLDVLLAMVRRENYPMERLPLGEITHQYCNYLRENPNLDVEEGAEFFETASWLVLLKSRSLLPKAAEKETPERELARVLLDHESLQAAARDLRERIESAGLGPGANVSAIERSRGATLEEPAAPPTVHDVVVAARRAAELALAQLQSRRLMAADPYPTETFHAILTGRIGLLESGRGVSTLPWFDDLSSAEAKAALLLALLELARLGHVLIMQLEPFGAVFIKPSVYNKFTD